MPFSKNPALEAQLLADIQTWKGNRTARRFRDILNNALAIAIDSDDLINECMARISGISSRALIHAWAKGTLAPGIPTQQAILGFIERRVTPP